MAETATPAHAADGSVVTVTSPQLFPPASGAGTGQLTPRVPKPSWLLHLLSGLIALAIGLTIAYALLVLSMGAIADDIQFLLFYTLIIVLLSAAFGDAHFATRSAYLAIHINPEGIECTAGRYSSVLPWSHLERVWVVRGSTSPVLCISTNDASRFVPKGTHWRIKTFANRCLFNTPIATPLVSSGLSESAVLDAMRGYLESYRTLTGRPAVTVDASPDDDHQCPLGYRRFRRRLAAWLTALAAVLISAVWLTTVTLMRLQIGSEGTDLDDVERILRVIAAVALAVGATLVVVRTTTSVYQAIVPLGNVARRFSQPIMRVGPEGVEHIVRGRLARAPWDAVQRVHLTTDPAGARYVCVTTADPHALVPPTRHAQATAKRNEQRHGAPVAVPLTSSGLTADDLLNAVRHYTAGKVRVG